MNSVFLVLPQTSLEALGELEMVIQLANGKHFCQARCKNTHFCEVTSKQTLSALEALFTFNYSLLLMYTTVFLPSEGSEGQQRMLNFTPSTLAKKGKKESGIAQRQVITRSLYLTSLF